MAKLQQELNHYIPKNVEQCKYSWVRNLINVNFHEVDGDINGFQEEDFDLQFNKTLKDDFSMMSLVEF
jgi:hypothetical protein